MTIEGLHALVDPYAGTQVTHLFFNPNAMRTSYTGQAWEPIYGQDDQAEGAQANNRWLNNAALLHERGLDPYAIWIARSREHGISPWLSMRMNDVHNADQVDHVFHSTFWRTHRDCWRVPDGALWTDRSLDYGRPEVRDHAMTLVRELLERYDPDGLELDWMRFGYHFRLGQEAAGCDILTDFTRQVRQLTHRAAQRLGHPVKLAARTPTDPIIARGLGMDGVRWAHEGLVDLLIPSPFWATADFDIPVELWREMIGDAAGQVEIAACLELQSRSHPHGKACRNDAAATRGLAAGVLQRGSDHVYLFNYMDSDTTVDRPEDYAAILRQCGQLATATRERRRHVLTYADTMPPGVAARRLLPIDTEPIYPRLFRVHTGPRPASGRAWVVLGSDAQPGDLNVRINHVTCAAGGESSHSASIPDASWVGRFEIPRDALCDGYQVVAVSQTGDRSTHLIWLEIEIDPNAK